jgi:Protein phosphatase 2C
MKDKTQPDEVFYSEQRTEEVQYKPFSVPVPGRRCKIFVACGYRRCLDFDGKNAPGQDFAAVCTGQGFVVGVVADGVSQSFYGDLAADAVGKTLLKLLWQERDNPPDEAGVEQCLSGIVERVQRAVLEKALPFPQDSIRGQALEKTRTKGSQTFFSAFIFDGSRCDLHLYQAGDTMAWIHYGDKPVEPPSVNTGRWSSVNQKRLGVQKIVRTGIAGMIVHSDGLRRSWAEQLEGPQVSYEDFEKEVAARSAIDDLSFISVAVPLQGRAPGARPAVDTAPRKKEPVKDDGAKDEIPGPRTAPDAEPQEDEEGSRIGKPDQKRRALLRLAAVLAVGILIGAFVVRAASKGDGKAAPQPPVCKPSENPAPLDLEAKDAEVAQADFLARNVPDQIKAGLKEGDIVALFEVRGAYVGRAEVRGFQEKEVFVSSPEQTFFAQVAGRGESDPEDRALDDAHGRRTPLTIELFDAAGKSIFKEVLKVRGRQQRAHDKETSKFLGYHEIQIGPRGSGSKK